MRDNMIKKFSKTTLLLTVCLFAAKPLMAQESITLFDEVEQEDVFANFDDNSYEALPFEETEDIFESGLFEPSARLGNAVENEINEVFEEVEDNTINLGTNNFLNDQMQAPAPFAMPTPTNSPIPVMIDDNFGEDLLVEIDDEIFAKMSDIEKQTALLTLELRRERIRTEIEAIKNQRQKAQEEELVEKERKRREREEWENEQQRKIIAEQTKLKEAAIQLEKVRQEKIVNAYKNDMLQTNQKWIAALGEAHSQVKEAEVEKEEQIKDFKEKMATLSAQAVKMGEQAVTAKENYEREIKNLQTQISILNSRIDTLNIEKSEMVDNPFATPGFGTTSDPDVKLSEEYIILEISGKGENLTAKISNKSGAEAFLIQKGTTLKSGHVIEEIAPTFIRANRQGEMDFIYFSAGGILDYEPDSDLKMKSVLPMGSGGTKVDAAKDVDTKKTYVSDSYLEQMFAR